MSDNSVDYHRLSPENWHVTIIDTGLETQTGGRIKKLQSELKGEEFFCLTYGDGLADIDITKLIKFHRSHGKLATVTAVVPPARYGALQISDGKVLRLVKNR